MMRLHSLSVNHVRNITSAELEFSPSLNLIVGNNGSGKTSLLESIYLLGVGRSFRTQTLGRVIQHEQSCCRIIAKLIDETKAEGKTTPLGYERYQSGESIFRCAGERVQSIAEVARIFPVQLLNFTHYQLIQQPPVVRRKMLDWGLFHVEPKYLSIWQQYMRVLKQRNALLRKCQRYEEIKHWDFELINLCELITERRAHIFKYWIDGLIPLVKSVLDIDLQLELYSGWAKKYSFEEALVRSFDRDKELGYSQHGAQRADFVLSVDGEPAKYVLSLGQQKILAAILNLLQVKMVKSVTGREACYIVDDLAAELDSNMRDWLFAELNQLGVQL